MLLELFSFLSCFVCRIRNIIAPFGRVHQGQRISVVLLMRLGEKYCSACLSFSRNPSPPAYVIGSICFAPMQFILIAA